MARSGLLLAAVLAVCRLASLAKELLVAGRFGAGPAIDAFALAMIVPAIWLALYVNAVRRGYLVEFPRQFKHGEAAAAAFTNRYLARTLAVAVGLACLATFALRWLWPLLLPPDRLRSLEPHLDQLSLPVAWLIVPFAAVSALTAVLNARNQFSRPQWTHVLPTAAIIVGVLVVGTGVGPSIMVWSLGLGTSLQVVVLAVMVRRAGHRFGDSATAPLNATRGFAVLILPFLLMDALGQANVLVDRGMAAGSLGDGRLSVLYWSAMGKDFLSGTLVASMLWVLLPHFSEQVARGDIDGLRRSCGRVVRFAAMLMLPISAMVAICGPKLLQGIELGALTADDTGRLGQCLAAYSAGLFPELAGLALVQALLVLGRWRMLAVIGLVGLFLPNLLFNLLLIGPLEEVGLALSTGLTAWLLLAAALLAIWRTIGIDQPRQVMIDVGLSLAATIFSALVAILIDVLASGVTFPAVTGVLSLAGGLGTYGFLVLGWPGHAAAREAFAALTAHRDHPPPPG